MINSKAFETLFSGVFVVRKKRIIYARDRRLIIVIIIPTIVSLGVKLSANHKKQNIIN